MNETQTISFNIRVSASFFFLQDGRPAKACCANSKYLGIPNWEPGIEVDHVPVTGRKHKMEASVVVVVSIVS